MTLDQINTLRHRAYLQHSERWRRIRAAAYPDTGGTSLYIHNWYACDRRAPVQLQNLAGIIANGGEWDTWHRIDARIDRWYQRILARHLAAVRERHGEQTQLTLSLPVRRGRRS